MNIVEAVSDRALLGAAFRDLESWGSWLAFLRALFALPMSDQGLEVFARHTGRSSAPGVQAREAWLVVGRRGGKSRIAATVAVYLACFRDYASVLAPGERGVVMLLAADRQQARVLLRYVVGMLESSELLSSMVEERLKESVKLTNGIDIEVHTSNYRAVRGYSIVAAVCDEIAFWRDETTANPDVEVINAIRPGLATTRESLLLAISSPYARRAALWSAFKANYGKDGPVLVWQADTRAMNPTIAEATVAEAYERDPSAAAAEWGGEFRRDIEAFVPLEAVEAIVVPERRSLPPAAGVRYFGFVDPSGGSQDSFTLAIAHREKERTVLDLVLERKPPFSPESVVEDFAGMLREYRISGIRGDRYGGEFPRELFAKRGIAYTPSEKTKSEIYGELLPLLTAGKLELLDDRRLVAQLTALERRTSRAGRDSIDNPPGGRDDVANAAAGGLVLAARQGAEAGAPVSGWTASILDREPDFTMDRWSGGR
jgi:hypothetical protein